MLPESISSSGGKGENERAQLSVQNALPGDILESFPSYSAQILMYLSSALCTF